ncbi:MAG: PEP/pyruvate-binding domain-containing protein, partial [Sciscionella sp.]
MALDRPPASPRDYLRKFAVGGDVNSLGGKGHHLAELYRAGFPVPDGFILTTKAFEDSIVSSPLTDSASRGVPSSDFRLELPDEIFASVHKAYKESFGSVPVIVRSSAVAEDAVGTSFAGLFTSVLNVDESGLHAAISDVYNSALSTEAVDYARQHGLAATTLRMAVVIQRQVEPWISGICFTAHPLTGESQYIVEFVQGHNADLVSGRKSPSRIVLNRDFVPAKHADDPGSAEVPISVLRNVAETAGHVAVVLGGPQDVEWAIDNKGFLFVLQSRPIAVPNPSQRQDVYDGQPIAQGVGVSPGVATGPVRRILSDFTGAEADHLLQSGDIAVGHALRIDHLPALAKCAGVISVESSMLSHVAIRTRELRIPCVGGITNALALAPEGQIITIDGTHGGVYQGSTHDPSARTNPIPVGLDPDRMKLQETAAGRIIYQRTNDGVMVFLKKPLDSTIRAEAVSTIADTLNVSSSEITVDEHLAWESSHAPSVVYMQYEILDSLRRDPQFANRLAEAQGVTQKLDEQALRLLVESTDSEASSLFRTAVGKLDTFKHSGERQEATEAAQLFDNAKKLAGDFVGITVIDVFGESAVRNHTEALNSTFALHAAASAQACWTSRISWVVAGRGDG